MTSSHDLPPLREAFANGTILESFEIKHQFCAAGMSVLFYAEHTQTARAALIKVLKPDLATNRWNVARFCHEARILGEVNCPGIPKGLTQALTHQGYKFFIMEYLDGESLESLIVEVEMPDDPSTPMPLGKVPLDEYLVFLVAHRISACLAKLHKQGVVHRDIKPGNIILADNSAYLCDFGLAYSERLKPVVDNQLRVQVHGNSFRFQTRTAGTTNFMSPEQARDGLPQVPSTDIYSLGATLLYALTGSMNFIAYSVNPASQTLKLPSSYNQKLQRGWDRIIAECMSADPEKRPSADGLFSLVSSLSFRP